MQEDYPKFGDTYERLLAPGFDANLGLEAPAQIGFQVLVFQWIVGTKTGELRHPQYSGFNVVVLSFQILYLFRLLQGASPEPYLVESRDGA